MSTMSNYSYLACLVVEEASSLVEGAGVDLVVHMAENLHPLGVPLGDQVGAASEEL